jgi:RNase P subunit RPR2
VSSNLKLTGALYFSAKPKLIPRALVCPICKKPLGSGGKRNLRADEGRPEERSVSTICSIKFCGLVSNFKCF